MTLENILQKESINISNLEYALNTQVLLTISDVAGHILYANEYFLKSMNYSKDEVVGKTHNIFKSGVHSSQFYQKLWETIMDGQIWTGAILNKSKNGSLIWFKTKIVPIMHGKEITHFFSIRNDITESVNTTEMLQVAQNTLKDQNIDLTDELEKNKIVMRHQRFSTIGEIASKMAHDLRNPLSVIRAGLENIQIVYGKLDGSERSFERIDNAIDRIAHQIEDVLDFVKNKELDKEFVGIDAIVTEAITLQNVPEKISIKSNFKDVIIYCDYIMICTALKNLIHNAIHACGKQGTIKVDTNVKGKNVVISVIDSGSGISDENINKIFEPLFTTKQRGTGLGLASVKTIVETHEGTISVKNNPTTFTIQLPLKPTNNSSTAS